MAREMKDSGIEWIGEIPTWWNIKSAFQIFTQVKCKNEDTIENNLLSLSYGKIKRKNIDTVGGLLPESFEGYNIIEKNDIVLRLTDLQNDHKSLRVGLSKERGIITSAYLSLRNKSNNAAEYLYYYLHTFDICKGFYGMGDGVRQGLNWDELKQLKIALPPLSEQEKISNYLDNSCSKIDEINAKIKTTIDEYKKLKQSVITEAVTKGIRLDREMKDSGIEWIGEIPKEWGITALKYLCNMQAGKTLSSEQISDIGLYPVYGGNGLRGYYSEYNSVGDYLLVGRQGALCGNVHKANGNFWATEHAVLTLCSSRSYLNCLYYLLIGMNLNQYASNTAAQPGLSVEKIINIRTCLIPIEEQQEIADYLDKKCAEIDAVIAKKEQLVTELENYKKSLIYEYVTGKKEVV